MYCLSQSPRQVKGTRLPLHLGLRNRWRAKFMVEVYVYFGYSLKAPIKSYPVELLVLTPFILFMKLVTKTSESKEKS